MKLYMKDKLVIKLISLPNDSITYVSQKWRDTKKFKILYELKKLGYFKQLSRFKFIRVNKFE